MERADTTILTYSPRLLSVARGTRSVETREDRNVVMPPLTCCALGRLAIRHPPYQVDSESPLLWGASWYLVFGLLPALLG